MIAEPIRDGRAYRDNKHSDFILKSRCWLRNSPWARKCTIFSTETIKSSGLFCITFPFNLVVIVASPGLNCDG